MLTVCKKGVFMKKILIATVLMMISLGSISARNMTLPEAQKRQFNLKHHEKQITAYHAKMGKNASKEVHSVVEGMKTGSYMYDLETARKVMREVYGHRMARTAKNIKQ